VLSIDSVVTSSVRLSNGVRLQYLEQGPATGSVVLMLHGYADSSHSYSRVLPLISDRRRVIVPDQRGHGDSDRPFATYSMDDFATDAVQLLDALRISSAVVVGHSMGSFVARQLAVRAPQRVARLVLIGTAPTSNNRPVGELHAAVQGLTDPVDETFVRDFQMSCIARAVPAEFMARIISESRKVPARVWKAAMKGILAYDGALPPQCRTLVLGGDADSVFSRVEQEAMAETIPGVRIHIETGIGHCLQWEDPQLFVELAGLGG
jgi:pimeloyl-ACP methyl ester carboxylesterase